MDTINEHADLPPGANARQDQRILSITPHGKSTSSIEAELRQRIDEIAQAIRDKDLERLMTFYASDVVVFDLRPPLDVRGAGAYRENFSQWFASFEGPLSFEFVKLRVAAGEGVALCHYLALITGARAGGRVAGYWVRGTTGFEQREGRWLVTHEHISMPRSN